MKAIVVICIMCLSLGAQELFDMSKIKDATSLNPEVKVDWHVVDGDVVTRQKLVWIEVGEFIPGVKYRVPVRFVVPADKPAKGFILTGGTNLNRINKDAQLRGLERDLLKEGVGVVYTIVQSLGTWGQRDLEMKNEALFAKTLNTHYSIQYWGWPAGLMRSVTAAYAEDEHFEKGKVLVYGSSKNGASPSLAIVHDDRITAVFATVSPICESPMRLCDKKEWERVKAHDKKHYPNERPHRFLGGTFGPVYNDKAMQSGKAWSDLKSLATRISPDLFISQNFEKLKKRGAEVFFHPGTHDFVMFDLAYCGAKYPQIPMYLGVNTGHGKKSKLVKKFERGQGNLAAFAYQHFFMGGEQMLQVPEVTHKKHEDKLEVKVSFPENSGVNSGRIYWMFDRGPDGSLAYIKEDFPDQNTMEMTFVPEDNVYVAHIPLEADAESISFFSNHGKALNYKDKVMNTFISSPYTRLDLK